MSISLRPRVTVIVPTFRDRGIVRCALESISWQTFRNFEVWVIGDARTEYTEEIVHSFCDPRIFWFNLPCSCGEPQRLLHEGLKRARGEYVAYLDENDLWLPNHLEVLVETMDRYETDIAASIIQCVHSDQYSTVNVPLLPELPAPPEASSFIHRKNIFRITDLLTDSASYTETFFKKAVGERLRIEVVPITTGLKFLWKTTGSDLIPQQLYIERLKKEPDFINKELSAILFRKELNMQKSDAKVRWTSRWARPFQTMLGKFLTRPAPGSLEGMAENGSTMNEKQPLRDTKQSVPLIRRSAGAA
jgi:glycosyltransferase involved in cell wall biosynthesis